MYLEFEDTKTKLFSLFVIYLMEILIQMLNHIRNSHERCWGGGASWESQTHEGLF